MLAIEEVPDIDVLDEVATQKADVHKLIMWDDEVTPQNTVVEVLVIHFGFSLRKAIATMILAEEEGKTPIFEGSMKEVEVKYVILIEYGITATIE